jgi:BirA family biotin operon repressor/biotin-[acetyl-CoA-carboxylase] ligase
VSADDLAGAEALIREGAAEGEREGERAGKHNGRRLGIPLHVLPTTTSTNDEANRGAKAGASHGTTWVAEEQTAGRGRRGRTWLSPGGDGLLFSVLLRLECAPSRLPPLALLAGLAARDAVARAAPAADVRIKWPNDVLIGPRKLAGVLVEAITVGARVDAVIVGIGINVHTRSFPNEIRDRATSIALESARALPTPALEPEGPPLTRARLLADVLATLERDLDDVTAHGLAGVRSRLERVDALYGRSVRSDGGEVGEACGIDDDGRLLVRLAGGDLVRWSAGEVHLTSDAVA